MEVTAGYLQLTDDIYLFNIYTYRFTNPFRNYPLLESAFRFPMNCEQFIYFINHQYSIVFVLVYI